MDLLWPLAIQSHFPAPFINKQIPLAKTKRVSWVNLILSVYFPLQGS